MSVAYRAVLWNRQKKIYDSLILAGIALYLVVFLGLGFVLLPGASLETRLIRGLGTCALLLLHVVLSIGPLARLDSRFLPLLYNRCRGTPPPGSLVSRCRSWPSKCQRRCQGHKVNVRFSL